MESTLPVKIGEALSNPDAIVPALAEWIGGRRWAGLSDVSNLSAKVIDSAVLEKASSHVILASIVEVRGVKEEEEEKVHRCFFLPILLARRLKGGFFEVRCRDGALAVAEAERTREYSMRALRGFGVGEEVKTRRGTIKFLPKKSSVLLGRVKVSLLGKSDTTNLVAKLQGETASLVLKTYKAVEEENPEPETLEVLAEAKFAYAPKLLGEILYCAQRPIVISVLESYEENVGDGGQPFLNNLTRGIHALRIKVEKKALSGRELAEFIKRETSRPVLHHSLTNLGCTIAEFHSALASSDRASFKPEKIMRRDAEKWAERTRVNLSYCLRNIPKLERTDMPSAAKHALTFFIQQIEARREEIEDNLIGFESASGMLKMRTHQDLHLAQLLAQRAKHGFRFLIIDFEGDPQRIGDARRNKEPPLRDVGTMARSFGYVKNFALAQALNKLPRAEAVSLAAYLCARTLARSAELDSLLSDNNIGDYLQAYVNGWEEAAEETLINSYLNRYAELGASYISDAPCADVELRRMVRVWKIEKALWEMRYEVDHRPQNVAVPMEGLLAAVTRKA